MTQIEILTGASLATQADRVAALLERTYPPGTLHMSADYLRWAFAPHPGDSLPSQGILAVKDGILVGFAGSTPITLQSGEQRFESQVVSFTAVAPEAQGLGLASQVYGSLLEALATTPDSTMLAFARDQTRGVALIETCHPRHGWLGNELEPMRTWGIPRRLIRKRWEPPLPPVVAADAILVAETPTARARMAQDPRVLAVTGCGIRIVGVEVLPRDGTVVCSLDSIPQVVEQDSLGGALLQADAVLPPEVRHVLVPELPEGASGIARSLGMRQVPLAPWRAWIWSRRADHPLLLAQRSLVPIT